MFEGPFYIVNGLNNADPNAPGTRFILGYEGKYPRRIAVLGAEKDFHRATLEEILKRASRKGLWARIFGV